MSQKGLVVVFLKFLDVDELGCVPRLVLFLTKDITYSLRPIM